MATILVLPGLLFTLVSCYDSVLLDDQGNIIEESGEPGAKGGEGTAQDSDTHSEPDTSRRGEHEGDSSGKSDSEDRNPTSGLDCVNANAGLCDEILCDFQDAWDDFMTECRLAGADCSAAAACYEDNMLCFLYACPPGSNMSEDQIDLLNRCLEQLSGCIGAVDSTW